MEHNLGGTLNLLEFCKARQAGLILLSTSRVYSLAALTALPLEVLDQAFVPRFAEAHQPGISWKGITEEFPTRAPVSLYGAAKLAQVGLMQTLAIEGAKYNIHVNALAPTAATRMTEGLMPQEVLDALKPEAVVPAMLVLAHESAPTRTILCAGAGTFEAAHITDFEIIMGTFVGAVTE